MLHVRGHVPQRSAPVSARRPVRDVERSARGQALLKLGSSRSSPSFAPRLALSAVVRMMGRCSGSHPNRDAVAQLQDRTYLAPSSPHARRFSRLARAVASSARRDLSDEAAKDTVLLSPRLRDSTHLCSQLPAAFFGAHLSFRAR
jgi:hypothetical protein